MEDREQLEREIAIEQSIYSQADGNVGGGFAIAYALIQCASALNRIANEMEASRALREAAPES